MTLDSLTHLSADELDAVHDGTAPFRATSHIATCHQCHTLVASDRHILTLLASLPTFDASPALASRVIAGLQTRPAVVAPAIPSPDRAVDARRRVVVGGFLTGGLVTAGFVWAAFNPATAQSLAGPFVQEITQTLWLSLQAVVANTIEQPWFGTVRDALATPNRAVPLVVAAAASYVAMLVGFRKLLTRSASNASW